MVVAVSRTQWLTDREQGAWRGYLTMHAQLTTQLNRQLQRDSGLSLPDFAVLVELTDRPESRMRFGALVEALQWDKSRASHHLARMRSRGLVDRQECPDDARSTYILLTDYGRATIESAAPDHAATVREFMFDQLTADEVDTLARITERVLTRLQNDAPQSEPEPEIGSAPV